MYPEKILKFTGSDFVRNLRNSEVAQVINGCLHVTVGDGLKMLTIT